MSKIACITGATSGIGWATAVRLAKEGIDLIVCGRRTERLAELKNILSVYPIRIHTLTFDVSDVEAVNQALQSLPTEWQAIDYLINNAGNAHGLAPIHEGDIADWDAMIDSNVKGLLYVSRAITPGMVARKQGHIINIGSIAGKEVYPNGNVYCGSKFAVDAITKGMRLDLNPFGIKVTGLHPGMVETAFSEVRFKGDTQRAQNVYKGLTPLTADDVADTIAFVLSRPAHVVLADIVLMPTDQASATVANRKS